MYSTDVCEYTSVDGDILALDRVSLERRGTSPARRVIADAGSGGRGRSDRSVTCNVHRIIADADSGEDYVSTKPVFSQVKVSQ